MRPCVVTVFAITGFCLSGELAAAAAQGGHCSGVGGNAFFTPISQPSLGKCGGGPLGPGGSVGWQRESTGVLQSSH